MDKSKLTKLRLLTGKATKRRKRALSPRKIEKSAITQGQQRTEKGRKEGHVTTVRRTMAAGPKI